MLLIYVYQYTLIQNPGFADRKLILVGPSSYIQPTLMSDFISQLLYNTINANTKPCWSFTFFVPKCKAKGRFVYMCTWIQMSICLASLYTCRNLSPESLPSRIVERKYALTLRTHLSDRYRVAVDTGILQIILRIAVTPKTREISRE